MIVRYSPGAERITVGADKGFDTADFVSDMRDFNVTPHVAQNTTNRLSAIALSAIVDTRSASRSASGLRSHSGGARPSERQTRKRRYLGYMLGWRPVTELIREIHEGDPSLRRDWPLEYWAWSHSIKAGSIGRCECLSFPAWRSVF